MAAIRSIFCRKSVLQNWIGSSTLSLFMPILSMSKTQQLLLIICFYWNILDCRLKCYPMLRDIVRRFRCISWRHESAVHVHVIVVKRTTTQSPWNRMRLTISLLAMAIVSVATPSIGQTNDFARTNYIVVNGFNGCFHGRNSMREKTSRDLVSQDSNFCLKWIKAQDVYTALARNQRDMVGTVLDGNADKVMRAELVRTGIK